jgi:folate-binding protein YgfZ
VSLDAEYADVAARGGLIDLSSRLKLSFTGADRLRYLNGQVTAKLTGVQRVVPACVTTAKGKLCADVFVAQWPDATVVDADPAVSATLPARLEKYIVADNVEVQDITETSALIHCFGIDAGRISELAGVSGLPANRFGIPGVDLFFPVREQAAAVLEKLAAVISLVSGELAEVLRVGAGIPRWGFELDENTLPAEAGLDRTHVDFHKGCYIGQEVISRIKSVGHVNRRLCRIVSQNGEPIPSKARIFAACDFEKEVGWVTSSVTLGSDRKSFALGYLKRGAEMNALTAIDGSLRISVHAVEIHAN